MSDPALYTVGWICAISTELVAAQQFLDKKHDLPNCISAHDQNTYTLGEIGKHNVVIAALPDGEYGTSSAAVVASHMLSSFSNVRIGLMVGIGGGAPSKKHDIRLGDIVVSSPSGGHSGVYQYDFGKAIQDKKFFQTGVLNQPPTILRTAVASIKASHEADGNQIDETISAILGSKPRLRKKYSRPDEDSDLLYQADYVHRLAEEACDQLCGTDAANAVQRQMRTEEDDKPTIHYGLIASANQLMKNALVRDALVKEKGVLCFEMEAAGLMNHFPCLVIRGICDYADSHKNKQWQGYAAMAAAAYARELLMRIIPSKVEHEQRISEQLSSMKYIVDKVYTEVHGLKSDKRDRHVYSWLSAPNPLTNHEKAQEQRHAGTGQWFLKSQALTSFKQGKVSFLWLHGIPGCGKTILSSTVIEDLQHPPSTIEPAPALLYFYFDFNDNQKQSLDNALRSLVDQLATRSKIHFEKVAQLYKACKDGKQQPSTPVLIQTLGIMIKEAGYVSIVLDALDECTTRPDLLQWIQDLDLSQSNCRQMIVTSRKEYDIESALKIWVKGEAIIPIQQLEVDEDICSYIHTRIRSDPNLKRWQGDLETQREMEEELMRKANGMFRWAVCQLDSLTKCLTRRQLKRALVSLPETLDRTYARIMDQIPTECREEAIRLLQVLTWSQRPLRIEEAVDFLAVDLVRDPGFDPNERMRIPREIVRLCSSLVTTIRVNGNADRYAKGADMSGRVSGEMVEELRLAHFSVKEYLVSDRLEERYQKHLGQIPAAVSIANITVTYLLHLRQDIDPGESRLQFPLADYAARSWMQFALLAESKDRDLHANIQRLLSSGGRYAKWLSLHDPDLSKLEYSRPDEERPQALYYASLGGLQFVVNTMLAEGANVNAQGGQHGNALQAACARSHIKVAEMLVENGADVNARGNLYDVDGCGSDEDVTALYTTACIGHEALAEMLIENGADVNAEGGMHGNALQVACARGHLKLAEMLVKNGANVNNWGYCYYDEHGNGDERASALYITACDGHEALAEMLIENGADVNAQGGAYGNPLQAACAGGHEEVAETLIENGADINAQGGLYGSVLQAACVSGCQKVAEMLMEKGMDVNAHQDRQYGNALQAACIGGHEKVAKMLVEKGADVNARGSFYYCEESDGKGLRFLSEVGVTALYTVALRGYKNIAEMLLENGAEVNAQGGNYSNPLRAACASGHEALAEMLLEKEAGFNLNTYKTLDTVGAGCHEMLGRILSNRLDALLSRVMPYA